jgi:hypothetical protein
MGPGRNGDNGSSRPFGQLPQHPPDDVRPGTWGWSSRIVRMEQSNGDGEVAETRIRLMPYLWISCPCAWDPPPRTHCRIRCLLHADEMVA